MRRMLHVKPEDLRIYDFSDEENPRLLDDETATIGGLNLADGQKILVESMFLCTQTVLHVHVYYNMWYIYNNYVP